jgi:IS605 OrfB family transposase
LQVRLYPNSTQKNLLRQWMGCARLVYNMVVANYIRNRRSTAQFFFRCLLKHKINTTREWSFMKGVPYEVLDHAISGAIAARDEVITRNRERFQSNAGSYNRLAFRSKKDVRNTITIRAQYCRSPLRFYVRLLHNKNIVDGEVCRKKDESHPPLHHENRKMNHNWPNEEGNVAMDSTLTYDKRLRHWTFNWVHGKDARDGENQAAPVIAAIDPGIVTFATWYSPTLGTGSIGTRDIERIIRLCLFLDTLASKTTTAPARKRNSHKRAQARIRNKIRNLVDELHKKTALWAVRTFDVIVLPEFGAARMSLRKPGRRLNRKTVRKMLTWSHGRFRQRLLSKAEEWGKTIITSVSEAYTSKTCTDCGHIHSRLGGARVFRCSECGTVMDRDANAAKGILLRALASGALSAPETSVDEGFG